MVLDKNKECNVNVKCLKYDIESLKNILITKDDMIIKYLFII